MTAPSLAAEVSQDLSAITNQAPSSIINFVKSACVIKSMPEVFTPKKKASSLSAAVVRKVVAKTEYMMTKDAGLLKQYYALRDKVFRNECGWNKKRWLENSFDKKGDIFVAVENGKVIGGLRLMNSIDNEYLSDENPGTKYTYRNLLKTLGLNDKLHYVEIDGFVVKKGYRDRNISSKVGKCALDYAKTKGCSYVIAIASLPTCRNDRVLLKSIGYQEVYIASSFQWTVLEEYNNSKDFPIVSVLDSLGSKKSLSE